MMKSLADAFEELQGPISQDDLLSHVLRSHPSIVSTSLERDVSGAPSFVALTVADATQIDAAISAAGAAIEGVAHRLPPWCRLKVRASEKHEAVLQELTRLRAELDAVRGERDQEHKQLIEALTFTAQARPALNALARFTANLQLQDHPIAEQRKREEVVRVAMRTLQPDRKELVLSAWRDTMRKQSIGQERVTLVTHDADGQDTVTTESVRRFRAKRCAVCVGDLFSFDRR